MNDHSARGRGGRERSRQGRGASGRDNRYKQQTPTSTRTEGIPILRYGPDNNLAKFKEELSREAIEKFGHLGKMIEFEEYYTPARPIADQYDASSDPTGIELIYLKEQARAWQCQMIEMNNNKPKLYAMIWGKLSRESIDEIKRHENYAVFNVTKDPLLLWAAIIELHRVATVSKVQSVVRQSARAAYYGCCQGAYESIIAYKERFDSALEAYNANGNPRLNEEDVAMDFMKGLDNERYDDFKVELINDISMHKMKQPKTINEIYLMASRRIISTKKVGTTTGVAFTTVDSIKPKAKHVKKTNKSSKEEDKKPDGDKDKKFVNKKIPRKASSTDECYKCGQLGHFAKDCGEQEDDDGEKHRSIRATWETTNNVAYATNMNRFKPYEVCLDGCSDVSVMHPRFLSNLRKIDGQGFEGLSGSGMKTNSIGYLEDFFDCQACENCTANILCQADIEDMYDITYVQGLKYTVHLPRGNLDFERKGRFYVADMSDWIRPNMANVTTVTDNESLYTAKELRRARQAQDFIHNSGYPSEKEAVHLVSDGNITGVPLTAKDIHLAFDIYGKSPAAVRGKTTKQKIQRMDVDDSLREQRTDQVIFMDVMKVREQAYLVSVCEPLQLTMTSHVPKEDAEHLGEALQNQLGLLRSRGFRPVRVHADPQRGFLPLVGQFPGVEIDLTGAGDHLDKVDAKIRRLKEIIRSVHADLPWSLPASRVKDLVTYATSRINTRRTSASSTNVAPRVSFTGRKIDYKREYAIGFGDYCECFDPKAVSNNAERDRTEPCIALHPTANANGSWIMLNIKTNKYVRRTPNVKMVTSDIVISRMNQLAKAEGKQATTLFADEGNKVEDITREDVKSMNNTHKPVLISEQPITISEREADEDLTDAIIEAPTEEIMTAEETAVEPKTIEPEALMSNVEAQRADTVPDRRSVRIAEGIRKPVKYSFHTSVKKGLQEHGHHAQVAITSELKQLFKDKKALKPVLRANLSNTQKKKILRSSMFLKTKFDARGVFEKIKARLVADGRGQDKSLYPDNTSPTVAMKSLLMCLMIAAKEKRKIMKIDIGGAYLNAEMTGQDVIMELDSTLTNIACKYLPELIPYEENGKLLVKLDRALYGCIQSAKLWYDKLTATLRNIGFEHNHVDPCVMNMTTHEGQCTLLIYVDDILILSKSEADLENTLKALENKFDDVKCERGNDFSYLGMHIKINENDVTISMEAFVEDLLKQYGEVKSKSTPATTKLFDLKAAEELDKAAKKEFHSNVMRLLYLAKRLRTDIILPVMFLCTRVQCPTREDLNKLNRVIGYLKETKDTVVKLNCKGEIRVKAYIDAAFGSHADGKSHTGCAIFMGQACIFVTSRKQKIVTKDSTEAELVALSDMLTTVEQCQEFLLNQGMNIDLPVIFQDNMSTISLVTRGGGKPRNKHLRVRQELIKERISKKEIEIRHTSTCKMLADVLTKPMQGEQFKWMTKRLMGNATCLHSSIDRGALSRKAGQTS